MVEFNLSTVISESRVSDIAIYVLYIRISNHLIQSI